MPDDPIPDDAQRWPALHARIDAVRAAWQSATAELSGEERPPENTPENTPETTSDADASDDEAVWSAAQVHSHVANALQLYAGALSQVALSHEASFAPAQRMIKGHHPYPRLRQITDKAWTDFRGAALTVAKQPDRGAVISMRGDMVDARGLVNRAISHLDEHVAHMHRLKDGA